VELEQSYDKLAAQGLGIVAISYDNVGILKSFSDRKGPFRYSLLADPDSKIIGAFGLRNPNAEPGSFLDGVAFPGSYIVDVNGIVTEKFFNQAHRQRITADSVLLKVYNVGEGGQRIEADIAQQFKLTAYPSQSTIRRGNTIFIVVEINLYDKVHLYAPGSSYRAVDIQIAEHPALQSGELDLPEAESIHLEVINETVQVYSGKVRIYRELTLSPLYQEPSVEVTVKLQYQTCNDKVCFLPAELPMTFKLNVVQHDMQRAPEDVQHQLPPMPPPPS